MGHLDMFRGGMCPETLGDILAVQQFASNAVETWGYMKL